MEREEAIRWLTNEKWKNANNKYKKEWNEAFEIAIEALSADTVEIKPIEIKGDFRIDDDYKKPPQIIGNVEVVVRCKDCRFYWGNLSEDDTDEMYGECRWDSDEMPNADDFCSYGERREP